MIAAIFVGILAAILSVFDSGTATQEVRIIPPMPDYAPSCHKSEWDMHYENACDMFDLYFWAADSAKVSARIEFDSLAATYETKSAKNGAVLIRKGASGPFKFAKKGPKKMQDKYLGFCDYGNPECKYGNICKPCDTDEFDRFANGPGSVCVQENCSICNAL